jgi:hypothetical protein|nr:TraB/GumN family protein [Kofleriaceae bacterium]
MRRWLLVLAITACSHAAEPPPSTTVAQPAATAAATAGGSEVDPWDPPAVAPPADAPPSLADTVALADAACPTVPHPYLFAVTTKSGKTSFLLGTRHLGVGLAKLPPVVRDSFVHSTLAVFETDPKDTSTAPPTAHADPLHVQLGDVAWAHFRELAGRSLADRLDDEPVSTALIQLVAMYEDKSHALDLELENLAADTKIPTAGLESSAFQDALIEKLMDARALRAILVVAHTRADLQADSHDDLASYCAGERTELDPKEHDDMVRGGYSEVEIADYEDAILYARNRSWIPELEKIVGAGNAFIAVGADHLMGPRGVPALLSARGYTVTRVTP